MPVSQTDNFISILQAACGNGQYRIQEPDWDELIRMARVQMLTPLFYVGAARYPEFADCSVQQKTKLQMEAIAAVGQQIQRTQLFLQLYQALLGAGLRPLVLKGILCRNLYGELADYRPSCDEDLYLPPDQIEACRQALERNGWHLSSHEASMEIKEQLQEIAFDDANHQLHIELHPALFGAERPDQQRCTEYFRGVEQRAATVTAEGVTLYTLSFTDHYIYLFLHLAKHFANSGVGVRQIMDLMQFARAYGDRIDWAEVQRAVQKLSSPGLYADVAEIGRRLGFTPKPMFRPVDPDRLLADSMAGGVYGHDREGHGRGTVLTIAAQYPTRLQRIQRLLFPSPRQLAAGRPWLEKRPWLLPVAWAERASRLFVDGPQWGRVTGKSLHIAYQRVNLLRTYDLLPGRKPSPTRRG